MCGSVWSLFGNIVQLPGNVSQTCETFLPPSGASTMKIISSTSGRISPWVSTNFLEATNLPKHSTVYEFFFHMPFEALTIRHQRAPNSSPKHSTVTYRGQHSSAVQRCYIACSRSVEGTRQPSWALDTSWAFPTRVEKEKFNYKIRR